MDPSIIKAVGHVAADLETEAKGFIHALVAEPAREFGGLLKDKISAARHSNLIRIIVTAKRKLETAGVSAKEVPLKIIHPLLEQASLESDPSLQERWANLLANAASENGRQPRASFSAALGELSPMDALFLDALRDAGAPFRPGYSLFDLDRFYPHAGTTEEVAKRIIPSDEMLVTLSVLVRNGLLEKYSSAFSSGELSSDSRGISSNFGYRLTALGIEFVDVCRTPK